MMSTNKCDKEETVHCYIKKMRYRGVSAVVTVFIGNFVVLHSSD